MTETFGILLKRLRKYSLVRLTQQKVVCEIREKVKGYQDTYSKSDVSKWEHGKYQPPEEVIEILEEIVDAVPGSLLEAAGYPEKASNVREHKAKFSATLKENHLKDMTAIVKFLAPSWVELSDGEQIEPEQATLDELRSFFRKRLAEARIRFEDKKVACLYSHLLHYFKDRVKESDDIDHLLQNAPHENYARLWVISQQGVYHGLCEICKDVP